MKTNEEHVANEGLNCPVCGGSNLFYEQLITNGAVGKQSCRCKDCPATWYDVYLMTGFKLNNPVAVEQWQRNRLKELPADIVGWMAEAWNGLRDADAQGYAARIIQHANAGGKLPELNEQQQRQALAAWCAMVIGMGPERKSSE